MIYLTPLIIDLNERDGRRNIANCHQLHRTVMSAFGDFDPDTQRVEHSVLFRVHPGKGSRIKLFVQSNIKPDISAWADKRYLNLDRRNGKGYLEIPEPAKVFLEDMYLRYDLLACPAKKVGGTTREERLNGIKKNSHRVMLASAESRAEWLQRRGVTSGFQLMSVREDGEQTITGRKPDGNVILHAGVRFTGVLKIINTDQFVKCMEYGIGAGKAHGLGMLMVARC